MLNDIQFAIGCIIAGIAIVVLMIKNPMEWKNDYPYYYRTKLIACGIFFVAMGIVILYRNC